MIASLRTRAGSVLIRVLLFVALGWFYHAAATEHARVVNWFKARGDQSGYLFDAKILYDNWHGRSNPPRLVHRNRMPLYGAYQAALYDPRLTDDEFFVAAKRRNIALSLGLLAGIAVLLAYELPALAATNLTLVIAFGYFVFKAGYVQAELLFYALLLFTFVACWHLLKRRTARATLLLAPLAGALAALSHLTKAAMLPFVGVFVLVYLAAEGAAAWKGGAGARRVALVRSLGLVLLIAAFLGVLFPYLSNSKRVFRQYFYNVNTTFYAWYDDWPSASGGTYVHGDHEQWPTMPRSQLPGPRRYWREHTVWQILDRIGGGFKDMVVRSYTTFWYFKYVVLYAGFALLLLLSRPKAFRDLAIAHWPVTAFVVVYLSSYLVAVAFYAPISGTGTARFLLAHVAPLLLVLGWVFHRSRLAPTSWRVAGMTFTPVHFELLIGVSLALDIAFVIWPRLLTTYGGF